MSWCVSWVRRRRAGRRWGRVGRLTLRILLTRCRNAGRRKGRRTSPSRRERSKGRNSIRAGHVRVRRVDHQRRCKGRSGTPIPIGQYATFPLKPPRRRRRSSRRRGLMRVMPHLCRRIIRTSRRMFVMRAASDAWRDHRRRGPGPFIILRVCSFFLSQATRRRGQGSDRRRAGPLMRVRTFAGCRRNACRHRSQANDVSKTSGNRKRIFRAGVARHPQEGRSGQFRSGRLVRLPAY